MLLKIVAQAFEAGDFHIIFLRFFVFEAHFVIKVFLHIESHITAKYSRDIYFLPEEISCHLVISSQ